MAQLLIAPAGETGIGTSAEFVLIRLSDGAFWNGAAFEAYSAGNIATYGIQGTETGATGVYTVANPSEATPARFLFVKAAGASLAVSDILNSVYWEGEAGPAVAGGGSTAPTAAENAAAWGVRDLGNGRTADMYLQGYMNRFTQSADGLSLTLYLWDDVTVLGTFTESLLSTSVGRPRNNTPL